MRPFLKLLTADEMRRLDREAIETYGIPSLLLMERAGEAVAWAVLQHFKGAGVVTIVCGKGNNGGDGFTAGRYLLQSGLHVRAFSFIEPSGISGDARTQLEIFARHGGEIQTLHDASLPDLREAMAGSDVVIDAIFGTGLSKPVDGLAAQVIAAINAARRPVVSVDIPSGIGADDGRILGCAVNAAMTVTLGLPKRGLYVGAGAPLAGMVEIADIGIPEAAVLASEASAHLMLEDDIRRLLLPPRPPDSHKGRFGHVLIIAGSRRLGGAAGLASLAALRGGAGAVTLGLPQSVHADLGRLPLEVMTAPLPETEEGTLASSAAKPILDLAADKTVLAIGPGLSSHPETQALVREVAAECSIPMVIDADGLNALAGHVELLKSLHAPAVLTPHPGEMSRLARRPTSEIQGDRIGAAARFAQEFGVTCVLKGFHSVAALRNGDTFINTTGNAGMATAGAGDVLTGLIASLIAQGMWPEDAARVGVFLHGLAGDLAVEKFGMESLIAGDITDAIPPAIRRLREGTRPKT